MLRLPVLLNRSGQSLIRLSKSGQKSTDLRVLLLDMELQIPVTP